MPLPPGTHLGPYEILGPLGAGGMGEVYRARDTRLDRLVAVKVLPADSTSPQALERFEREARAIAALNHPGICAVYDVGASPVPYLVMELLEGETLHERLARGPLDVGSLVETALVLADSLAAAHGRGIVHRDLKPANIVLTPRGPKILDFGLARSTDAVPGAGESATTYETLSAQSPLTGAGVTVGTVAYMSPEQLRGEALDARTDLFSMGLVLYEMATGRRAFGGTTSAVISAAILHEQPAAPRQLRADLPPRLEQAIVTLLEKDRDVRTQSASELRAELTRIKRELGGARAAEPATSGTASAGSPSGPASVSAVTAPPSSSDVQIIAGVIGRHRGLVLAAGALALLVLGVIGYVATRPSSSGTPATRAADLSIADIEVEQLTTSGTAAAPAISPDGNFVAYVEQGQNGNSLRVRQIATGSNVEVVPAEPGVQLTAPAVSPDGAFVTYLRAADPQSIELWQVPFLGGTPRRVLQQIGSSVGFSPDGSRMAFTRVAPPDGTELVVAARDGSDERVVASRRLPELFWTLQTSGGLGLFAPAWSPDGRTLAVLGGTIGSPGGKDTGQVVFVDAGSGSTRAVDEGPPLIGVSAAWLSERAVILSMLDRSSAPLQLWILSYPEGEFRRLSNDVTQYVGLSLTRDRDTLVTGRSEFSFSISTSDTAATQWTEAVPTTSMKGPIGFGVQWLGDDLVYPASTSGGFALMRRNGSTGATETLARSGGNAEISRDGSTIVFFDYDAGELWKMDGRGENRALLRRGFGSYSTLTPDGRYLAFARSDSGGAAVHLEPVDGGGGARDLTSVQGVGGPVEVSPDGRLVAFRMVGPQGQAGVAVCELDACAPRPTLPSLPGRHWMPDSRGIAYVDPRTQSDLWVQPIDGGAPRQLTHFASDGRFIVDFAWSSDGRRLAVARSSLTNNIVLLRGLQRPE